MHAILIADDKSLVWSEVPDPVRKDGEVIIEIHAAALNRADLLQPGAVAGSSLPPSAGRSASSTCATSSNVASN